MYKLEPKMPSCLQVSEENLDGRILKRKQKQFSVEQTVETRFVTKVNFLNYAYQ